MTDQTSNDFHKAASAIQDGTATTEDLKFWVNHPYRCSGGELGDTALQLLLERIEKADEDKRGVLADKASVVSGAECAIGMLDDQLKQLEARNAEWNALYVRLTNNVQFADNGEGCYVADGDLMCDFDKVAERDPAASLAEAQAQAIPQFIRDMGERITTQDNRITAYPFFCVFQKREIVVAEDYDHDRIVWCDEEGNEADSEMTSKLDHARAVDLDLEDEFHMDGGEWRRIAVKEVDEFVTGCFTEDGCKQHLKINGHNLRKPFIYVTSMFRNEEMNQLREWIISQKQQESAQ